MNTSFQNDNTNNKNKVPSFLILKVQKVAVILEKMIEKKKRTIYMYKWMVWVMKFKLLFP